MTPKEAVALSNGMIFFTSATKYFLSIKEKHPSATHKPQIDYNIALIFNPMILFGAYLGVIINTILPDLVILALVVVTIFVATLISLKKGLGLYKKETKAMALALLKVCGVEGLQIKPDKEANQEKSPQMRHLKPKPFGLNIKPSRQPLGAIKESENKADDSSP